MSDHLKEIYAELEDGFPEEGVPELLEAIRGIRDYWKQRKEYVEVPKPEPRIVQARYAGRITRPPFEIPWDEL